ncbi:hypothetical protein Tco_1217727 [Tanacetum coccineum]
MDEILKKFGFSTVKTASTHMETSKPLMKDENDEDVDVHLYRSMIGSLMYLTSSRPDIMFAVCACARFQATPKVSHLHAVKIIFRYLKGQPKLGLWYPKDSAFDLEAYTDSDYAGASLDRKSTTGGQLAFCLKVAFCSLRFVSRLRFAHCVLSQGCVLLIAFCLKSIHPQQIVKCTTISWQLVQKIVHQCLDQEDIHNGGYHVVLRYIDTKPNGEGLRKSILSGPYVPSTVLVQAVAATEGVPAVQQHTTIETVLNMTPENKEHFLSEKEAIFLLLTGIGDDIYSTVDACKTANEMWIAIERLQQGESLNVQDVKTNLFWEFGKFTSRDGESMESYYSRFYKLMNELTRKQPCKYNNASERSIFLNNSTRMQYQNEVNDIRAERIAKSANPLALLAAAQPYSDNYYQAPKLKDLMQHHLYKRPMHLPDTKINSDHSKLHSKLTYHGRPPLPIQYVKSLEKEVDELNLKRLLFQTHMIYFSKSVSQTDVTSYLHSLSDLNAYAELQCLYLHKVKECECLAQKFSKQTESVNKEVHNKLLKSFAKLENHSISLELALQQCKEQMKNNSVCKENGSNVFRKEREQYHEIQDLKAQMQDKNIAISELKKLIEKCKGKSVETQFDKPSVVRQPNAQRIPKPSVLGKPTPFSNSPKMRSFQTKQSVNKTNVSDGMYRIATTTTQNREPQLPHASRNTNPHVSKSSGVNHTTSVSRPQLKCYQVKDKVVPNNSQVKFKKKEVEDHHRISSISKKTKSVTACNDSSKSRTSNVNVVCAECGKCMFNSNHDACVSRYLNDVNARTKKPNVVPISASKPKRKMNKSVATPHKKIVASDTTI